MAKRRQMRIILPGMALCLALAACGGGNDCSRACRKLQTCLDGMDGDRASIPAQGSGLVTYGATMDCSSTDTCSEQEACQAGCMLSASCAELLGGSNAVAACVAQCATIQTPSDPGLLKPVGSGPVDCMPDCSGKQCGDDGCGGSCGGCNYGEACSYGICVASCVPDCYGLQCGDDGCGGSCGSCGYGETCSYGSCVPTSTGSSNSGQVCSDYQSCPAGDDCLLMEDYATTGMCLGQCSNTGDLCPVSSSSQLSVCAVSAQTTGQYYCAWICEVQGTSYACPNSYDYDCKVFDATQPDIKLCMPK
jgi:hypothetical protein